MSESPEWHRTRKDVQSIGNRVAEVGLEYFCLDYVSKNGVSVMEHNSLYVKFLCCCGIIFLPCKECGKFPVGTLTLYKSTVKYQGPQSTP